MNTPILLITFNRPDTTKKVFEAIRQAKPPRLYVSIDGPRKASDLPLINQVKSIIKIDWPCEVFYKQNKVNKGLRTTIVNAINWFFTNESQGIILEDDCVPHFEFFDYCEANLLKYKDDPQVMHISGYLPVKPTNITTPLFTHHMSMWGWATWKSAWDKYIENYNGLDQYLKNPSKAFIEEFGSQEASRYMMDKFLKCSRYQIDTWDYGWQYSIIKHKGYCLHPPQSYITNIGFGKHATNTFKTPKPKKVKLNQQTPNKQNNLILFKAHYKNSLGLLLRKLIPSYFYNFNS